MILFLVCLIFLTLTLLVTQAIRIETLALSLVAVLGLSGLLEPVEALSGFSSPATLTVAAMLILSAGLQRAGVVDYIVSLLMRRAQSGFSRLLLLISVPTAVLSAFMNNTAIVALMIPVALTLGQRTQLSASKLLLPISYLSILAGTCTLIGTSTNILVDSLYRQAGGPGFGMFEFSSLGLIYLVIGGVYTLLLVPRLLPERGALTQLIDGPAAGQFVTEVVVPEGSHLVDKSLREAFGERREIRILELVRDEEAILRPSLDKRLQADDVLLIEGTAKTIHEMINQRRFELGTAVADTERVKISRIDLRMVEAVVTPNSGFLLSEIQDLALSKSKGIQVLAVRRLGRQHQYKQLRHFRLRSGDVLLLQGQMEAFHSLQEDGDVLLIKGVDQTLTFPRKAPLAIGILLAVVALASFKVAPIVLLAFGGVGAMLLTGCLTLPHATRALDTSVLLLLAGMIPLGLAMEKTGLALMISETVLGFAGAFGPVFLIGAFYLLTSLLSEVLSNNASAVLLTPICLSVAAGMGIDPKPLLMAVTFGASASFATPIGYQTNTMVMGPGGYLFRDYLRVGVPLNLMMWITATLLIPVIWPP